ncbi:MAG: transglycosylase family protein [Aeromicrobium sp.]
MRHPRHFFSNPHRSPRKKSAIIALNIAVLMVLVGGTAAYGALSKTVTVKLDGRTDTVRTFSDSVRGVLASKDVKLNPDDKVNVAKTSAVTDGDTIKVDFAKPVTVAVDGSAREGTVHENTVGEVLDRYEVEPADDAYVNVSRSARVPRSGMQIVVSNPKKITVKADDDTKKFTSSAPRVKDALKEADVTLDKDDEVNLGRGALLSEGDRLTVTRIEMIDKTETVDVKPPVEYKDDADMEKGTTKVLEAGKPGKARENVLITKADGKVRNRLVLTSEKLEKPVKRVVARGTAEAPSVASGSVWDKIAECESGGNWSINTGNGYYGGLQFSAATWHSVGGPGLPHEHSRETQIKYAEILQKRSGWGQWGCAHARF